MSDGNSVVGEFARDVTSTFDATRVAAVMQGGDATRVVSLSAPAGTHYKLCRGMLPAIPLVAGSTTHVRFAVLGGEYDRSAGFAFGLSNEATIDKLSAGVFVGTQGNLQDGNRALQTSWAHRFAAEQPVDWYIETSEDELRVFICSNNVPCGQAYHMPGMAALIRSAPNDVRFEGTGAELLRPTIRFDAGTQEMIGAVAYWNPTPTVADAPYHVKEPLAGPGMTGDWQNTENQRVVYHIEDAAPADSNERSVRLSVRIGNSMNMSATVNQAGEVVQRSPIISTMMMPMPVLAQMDRVESNFLEHLTSLRLNGDVLTMISSEQTREFRRHANRKPTVEINPFIEGGPDGTVLRDQAPVPLP